VEETVVRREEMFADLEMGLNEFWDAHAMQLDERPCEEGLCERTKKSLCGTLVACEPKREIKCTIQSPLKVPPKQPYRPEVEKVPKADRPSAFLGLKIECHKDDKFTKFNNSPRSSSPQSD
jgi:hypothetical protein